MKKQLLLWNMMFVTSILMAQASFSLSVNKDTLLMGHTLKVKYTLEEVKARGGFKMPDFANFRVVAGPNTSSSISIVNGERSSVHQYTYFLLPESPGNWIIPEVVIQTKKGTLTTAAKPIVVLPNPNNIQENKERQQQGFPLFRNQTPRPPTPPPAKPKRKTYKI